MDRAVWRVIAPVRRQEDAVQLRIDASGRLCTVLLDATDADQIAETAGAVGEFVGDAGLRGLVDSAGIPGGGLLGFLAPG